MNDLALARAQLAFEPRALADLKLAAKGPSQGAALREAAEQFEGLFIQQMLSEMRKTVPEDGLFSSAQEGTFRDLADQQLAQDLAKSGDFGIAEALVRQLERRSALSPEEGQP
jgi:flagellar protein FlgJ